METNTLVYVCPDCDYSVTVSHMGANHIIGVGCVKCDTRMECNGEYND